MKFISREEFEKYYPRKSTRPSWKPGVQNSTTYPSDLVVERDARVQGTVHGDLRVTAGAQAEVTGIVKGSLRVESDGVLYLTGVVEGDMQNDGSVLLIGVVNGNLTGAERALIATGDRSWH